MTIKSYILSLFNIKVFKYDSVFEIIIIDEGNIMNIELQFF